MVRTLVAVGLAASLSPQTLPGAKQMFYDPGDLGLRPVVEPRPPLRPIRFARPFYHCGIHYWLQTEDGTPVTENRARSMPGEFTLHLRNNIASGFLTVWELSEGRELTPKDDRWSGGGRWSGIVMTEQVYIVPGVFEFRSGDAAKHVVIVWARSQTEVAHSAARARARVKEMPAWMSIVSELDESTPGEIGTYVVNRDDAGVVAEIVFRSR